MNKPKPDLLTVVQFATLMGVHKMTVYRWIEAGRLRVVRVGRTLRIPRKGAVVKDPVPKPFIGRRPAP